LRTSSLTSERGEIKNTAVLSTAPFTAPLASEPPNVIVAFFFCLDFGDKDSGITGFLCYLGVNKALLTYIFVEEGVET
jgi:hypothetical protein